VGGGGGGGRDSIDPGKPRLHPTKKTIHNA